MAAGQIRGLVLGAFISINLIGNAQIDWVISIPIIGGNAQVQDAQILNTGETIALVTIHDSNDTNLVTDAASWIARISPNGTLLSTGKMDTPGRYTQVKALVKGGIQHPYTILATTWDSITLLERSVGQFQMTATGQLGDYTEHPVLDGTHQVFFNDAALDADSAWFLAGATKVGGGPNTFNRVFLMRFTQDGTLLDQRVLDSSGGYTFSSHAAQSDSLMMVSVFGGTFGMNGIAKYLRFNTNLDYVGGFPGLPVSGSGNPTAVDSIPYDGQSMTVLPSGSILISAKFGTLDWARFATIRANGNGDLESTFLPLPEVPFEYCALHESHDSYPNGTIVTAVLQNANIYNFQVGTIPSRIHIYKLDTMLNVLCDQVAVDGAEDGSYYMLNRVKATPDGGTLLMGSKMNVNTQSLPQPWIMKIAPWDCQSGIGEHEPANTANVWPNPGSTGFTAFVNGPVVSKGTLQLYNAQGQLAASTEVLQSTATMDASGLAPGVYLYRITDGNGVLRASGRWVKE